VILVGGDTALLEGLAQSLIGCGHDVAFAATVPEAATQMNREETAIVVVSSEAVEEAGSGATLPLTPNGALIVYSKAHGEHLFLPPKLQRATLAHLVLPLERQRLLALVQSFDSRSRTTGRSQREERGEDFHLQF
jgi:DNA-binding NtrC family response regulator